MYVLNHTGQIAIPYRSLRGVIIEYVSVDVASGFSFPTGSASPSRAVLAERFAEKPVRARFVGDGITFDEYYLSVEKAHADLRRIERASRLDGDPLVRANADFAEYERYIGDYRKAVEAIRKSGEAAYKGAERGIE